MRISDWSSDVCSSDLPSRLNLRRFSSSTLLHWERRSGESFTSSSIRAWGESCSPSLAQALSSWRAAKSWRLSKVDRHGKRSEERRVGKEGASTFRYRWSPYH